MVPDDNTQVLPAKKEEGGPEHVEDHVELENNIPVGATQTLMEEDVGVHTPAATAVVEGVVLEHVIEEDDEDVAAQDNVAAEDDTIVQVEDAIDRNPSMGPSMGPSIQQHVEHVHVPPGSTPTAAIQHAQPLQQASKERGPVAGVQHDAATQGRPMRAPHTKGNSNRVGQSNSSRGGRAMPTHYTRNPPVAGSVRMPRAWYPTVPGAAPTQSSHPAQQQPVVHLQDNEGAVVEEEMHAQKPAAAVHKVVMIRRMRRILFIFLCIQYPMYTVCNQYTPFLPLFAYC